MMVDFTEGSCTKQLVRFGIPLLIGNLFQQLYTIVDSIVLGRFVGVEALAAAGAATPVVLLLLSVISGFTLGASIVIAQLFGRRNMEGIRRCFGSALVFNLLLGVLISVLCFLFSEQILVLMKTPQEVLKDAVFFLKMMAIGLFFQGAYQFIADALRAVGDSRTPLVFLVISCVTNIILDLVFTVVLSMGIAGVAYATLTAQVLSCVLCAVYCIRKYEMFRLNRKTFAVDRYYIGCVVRFGFPGAMQQMVSSLGAIGLQGIINGFGKAAMAAYGSAYKIDNFIMLPIINLGAALSTFVSQNLGADKMDRIRQGIKATSKLCAVLSVALSAVIFIMAEKLLLIFVKPEETETIRMGVTCLRVLAPPFLINGQLNVFISFFRGIGAVRTAFYISLSQVILRILLAGVFSRVSWIGVNAIWFCMPVTWLFCGAFSLYYYLSGRWKKTMAMVYVE
jgi:putative MATE family efflux protein